MNSPSVNSCFAPIDVRERITKPWTLHSIEKCGCITTMQALLLLLRLQHFCLGYSTFCSFIKTAWNDLMSYFDLGCIHNVRHFSSRHLYDEERQGQNISLICLYTASPPSRMQVPPENREKIISMRNARQQMLATAKARSEAVRLSKRAEADGETYVLP